MNLGLGEVSQTSIAYFKEFSFHLKYDFNNLHKQYQLKDGHITFMNCHSLLNLTILYNIIFLSSVKNNQKDI